MSLAFRWDSVLPAPSSLLLSDHCTHFHITLIHGIMSDSIPAGYFPLHFLVATGATEARSGAHSLWVLALTPSNPKRWQIRYPPSKEGRAGESSFSPSFIFPLTQESHFCSCDYRIISQVEKKIQIPQTQLKKTAEKSLVKCVVYPSVSADVKYLHPSRIGTFHSE